jgi:hypothetical protein
MENQVIDNQDQESRMTILEARIAFCEQRLATIERAPGGIQARKTKRELTPEEKKAVRERLVKGQEAARARREAEASITKKEANHGTSKTEDQG